MEYNIEYIFSFKSLKIKNINDAISHDLIYYRIIILLIKLLEIIYKFYTQLSRYYLYGKQI